MTEVGILEKLSDMLDSFGTVIVYESHEWQYKRSYDLPGPRIRPKVTVHECKFCGIVMETSRWHEPSPQYFEEDSKDADRIRDLSLISKCPERRNHE